ncbi:Bifunctional purine biosynthesis protein PurH [Coemansia biformis]|uniref:Bifunctional purine biosynthesis protein PurH n=1 Tax=Coemansia biformis TaxID=1286918 RepID=A0A9W7YEI2_9FUNG|nr:Bifunctional purine biosynthesis protein PurH [Coemansia biformis]
MTAADAPAAMHLHAEAALPSRPASIHHAAGTGAGQSMPSLTTTASATDGKSKGFAIAEADEQGRARADSRYSRLNRRLLLCAVVAAISSINYGWVIGSVNIPAMVIEQCSDGPETWTSGFPSCIPMNKTLWGLVVGLTPLGAWAGSMLSGLAADRFGRKRTLVYNNAFYVVGALLAGTTTSVAQLAIARFVSGIGCGVAANVVSTYNSEVSTIRARGLLGGFQQLMILAGVFLSQVAAIGLAGPPLWRVLFSISAAIAIGQTLLLLLPLLVPESPKFLVSKGRVVEAQAALQKLRRGLDTSLEFEDLLATLDSAAHRQVQQPSMWQVLSGRTEVDLRHLVFCVLFLMAAQQWSGVKGVLFYSTEILSTSFHLTKEEERAIPTIAQLLTMGIGAVGAMAVVVGMVILDKFGRRTVLRISSLATTVFAVLIVVGSKLDIGPMVATAMYLFSVAFQSGAGFIPYLCASELLPYYALGSISGLATAVNCLTLFVVSFTFPILNDALGAYLFVPFVVTNGATFLFSVFMMPEAKGRSVADIIDEYKGPIRIVAGPFVRHPPIHTSPTSVLPEKAGGG